MLEWCPQSPNDELLFNDVMDGSPVGVRLNVQTGARQVYIRPFAAAGGEGARAASLNLIRIERLHPGEGIAVSAPSDPEDTAPDNDGLFLVGLTTGFHRMLLSIAAVADVVRVRNPKYRKHAFWFERASFNSEGTRLMFTVFAGGDRGRLDAALYTIGIDGAGLREVVPFGRGVTGGAWLDPRSGIAVFKGDDGMTGPRVFRDVPRPASRLVAGAPSGTMRAIPSPDGRRVAIETANTRRRSRGLVSLDVQKGTTRALGDFRLQEPAYFSGPSRCELSPRWNASGATICIDAVGAEATRQLHLVTI